MSLDLLKARAKEENPTHTGFYDITDPLIRAYAIKSQPCWATYSAKDTECQMCPLAEDCSKAKAELDEVKARQKAYKEEHKEELELEKTKKELLKKLPVDIRELKFRVVQATQKEVNSKISDQPIPAGSSAVWVEGFGIITTDEGKLLGLIK